MMKNREDFSLPAFLLAGLCSALVVYLLLALSRHIHPEGIQDFVTRAVFVTVAWTTLYYLLKPVLADPVSGWRGNWFNILIWLACFGFAVSVVYLCLQFPGLFSKDIFLPNTTDLAASITVLLISLGGAAFLPRFLSRRGYAGRFEASRLYAFLVDNLPGFALAILFLFIYFSLAVAIGVLPDDNFYDTDSTSWLNRFAAPADQLIEMRPVHPFAFLVFRPLVRFVSLFLAGDRLHASWLLNSVAGALCVLLAWLFIKGWSRNTSFSLLIAALLGLSTSHLILSMSLETYVSSAAALIFFMILIQRKDPSLKTLVPVGLLTFGITLTNFIQTLIVFLFMDRKFIKIIKYVAIVLGSSLVLAYIQTRIYPTSQPFYIASTLLAEDRYSFSILDEGPDRTLERANALGRSISLFSIVAPRPLVLFEETGCEFPCIQTYKHRWNGALMNSYAGLGSFLARTWFILLLIAAGLFLWKMIKSRNSVMLQASLLACILFNFALHMNYGDDPMLYSADWTYAVIFFAALSFGDLADKRWFQSALLVFLALLMINQWSFLMSILRTLAPYLH